MLPTFIEIISIFRILFSLIFLLFLPGFTISLAIFPIKQNLNFLERMVLSVGLSVCVVPITIFYTNYLFSIPVNFITIFFITLFFITGGLLIFYFRINKN